MAAIDLYGHIYRQAQATVALELLCQSLELTETQHNLAEDRYNAVGNWLADSADPRIQLSQIYPQGSIGLCTTVKPLNANEFDIDLVCFMSSIQNITSPAEVKKLIGDRLKEHGKYKAILEEKPRCWRLRYADEFHLDITPSIPNHGCNNGGELVPDKLIKMWKFSNPRGYRQLFERRAKLIARFRTDEAEFAKALASIEAIPGPTKFKGLLRRCVQLCKRHRDLWAEKTGSDFSPISIIITTLAAQSYEYCVANRMYDTEYDLLIDVVNHMPAFIETHREGPQVLYYVWNETTEGENFAEKWNQDPRYAQAFYAWNDAIKDSIKALLSVQGMDFLHKSLSSDFGELAASKAMSKMIEVVSNKRRSSSLHVASGIGLSASPVSATPVKSNTFYGR